MKPIIKPSSQSSVDNKRSLYIHRVTDSAAQQPARGPPRRFSFVHHIEIMYDAEGIRFSEIQLHVWLAQRHLVCQSWDLQVAETTKAITQLIANSPDMHLFHYLPLHPIVLGLDKF